MMGAMTSPGGGAGGGGGGGGGGEGADERQKHDDGFSGRVENRAPCTR